MTTTQPTPPPPRRSLLATLHLATWRGRFAWFFTLILFTLAICWVLTRMTPAWYRPLDPDDPGVEVTANNAQSKLLELSSSHDRPQAWTITQDELNSLLAVVTAPPFDPATLKREPVDPARNPVSDPYIVLSKGQITLCARATKIPSRDPQGGVGSLTFSVGIVPGPDGQSMGLVKLTHVFVGNLPMPKSLVESRLHAMVPTIYALVKQASQTRLGVRNVTTADPFLEQFALSLGEGRPFPLQYTQSGHQWTVTEIHVDEGSFTFTVIPSAVVATRTATRPATSRPATAH